jgi:hypothetical protein
VRCGQDGLIVIEESSMGRVLTIGAYRFSGAFVSLDGHLGCM